MNKKAVLLDPPYLDDGERQIMQAFDRGEFQLSPNQARARREHQAAAKATLSNLRVARRQSIHCWRQPKQEALSTARSTTQN